jgi:hypothetical protein
VEGGGGEAPVIAGQAVVEAADLRDAGHGHEQHAARFQRGVQIRQRRLRVVDEAERLSEDDAVERVLGQRRRHREVADDRHPFAGDDADHFRPLDARAAEAPRVRIGGDFEDDAANVVGVRLQEALDVMAVERGSAVRPVLPRLRLQIAEVAPVGRPEQAARVLFNR